MINKRFTSPSLLGRAGVGLLFLAFAQGAWAQEVTPHFTVVKDPESGVILEDGTEVKPFLITSVEKLNFLAEDVNNGIDYNRVYFRQTADITYAKDDTFTPIGMGDEENYGTPFKGYFDGGNHTISGITYNGLDDGGEGVGIGLFGYVHPATIKNVKLDNCSFTGNWEVGAIVGAGYGDHYVIENCTLGSNVKVNGVSMTLEGEEMPATYIGGIVGYGHSLTISNCYSEATVSGGDFVGAIAGYLVGGENCEAYIENCYSSKGDKAIGGRGSEDEYAPSDATDGVLKITLFADDSEQTIKNATRLSNYNGLTANVTMSGLTLTNDGKWSTICLPFEMSGFDGTPFAGANVKAFKAAECKVGTLTATFEDASKIEVGMPYIVKGAALDSPVFEGVKVGIEASAATVDPATFTGTFNPITLNENDRTALYLGDDNKLYYPTAAKTLNPFQAYFMLQNGIKAGNSVDVNGDKEVSIADVTSLVNILLGKASDENPAADVNEDGSTTIADVTALVNILLGKETGVLRSIKTDEAIGISYGFGGK